MSPSEKHLQVYSNGGHMYYNMRGTLDILPSGIYVHDNSMKNIVSLKEVEDSFWANMDTKLYHTILVHYSKNKGYFLRNVERTYIISTYLTQKPFHWQLRTATPIIIIYLLWIQTWSILTMQRLKDCIEHVTCNIYQDVHPINSSSTT